ncbi:MAG: hypothetical protein AAGJ82_02210 [Bacteroidota bacterium]
MALEELQRQWDAAGQQNLPTLAPDKIKNMIQARYRRHLWQVIWPEIVGSLVCLYFAALTCVFFHQLDTPFLRMVGVVGVLLLLAFPLLSLVPLVRMYRLGQPQQPFRDQLADFARQKVSFLRVQQVSVGLGFVLFNAMIIICTKIYNEQDVTQEKYFWAIALVVGFSCVYCLNYLSRRYYGRKIAAAEQLLLDLQAEN